MSRTDFVSDSLSALEVVVRLLDMMHDLLHCLYAPHHFAQRVEASVGHSACHHRAIYASILFWALAVYDVYDKVFVALLLFT
jgi:hypothetical protein